MTAQEWVADASPEIQNPLLQPCIGDLIATPTWVDLWQQGHQEFHKTKTRCNELWRGCDAELACLTIKIMGKTFVLAQPHCHGNPFLPKSNSGLPSESLLLSALVCFLHLHTAVLQADCSSSLIYQGWPWSKLMDEVPSFDERLWGCSLDFQSHCWHSEKEVTGSNAHEFANCCTLQKLGQNFSENWHDWRFPYFFFLNNHLQKPSVCYCYQQSVQWKSPLNISGTSIQNCSEKAG